MRILLLLGCAAWISACSSYSMRCDRHLRPINPQAAPAHTSPAPAKP
jgi:hypothetical protein